MNNEYFSVVLNASWSNDIFFSPPEYIITRSLCLAEILFINININCLSGLYHRIVGNRKS